MRRVILTCLLLTVPMTGCAPLLARGPSQIDVSVEEPQENVEALIQGVSNGQEIRRKVPFFTVTLDRHSDYLLTVGGRGYRPQTIGIGRQLQPGVLGDLALLGAGAYGLAVGIGNPSERVERLGGVPVLSLGAGLTTMGLLGLGWGVLSGAVWRHTPDEVVVTLEKDASRSLWPFW